MPHPEEDPYHTPSNPRSRRPLRMSGVEQAMANLQDAIQDERAGQYPLDDLNARLQAYKWTQANPEAPRTPRTPASPMPASARHSAPPEAGLASPFRTGRHSRQPSAPQTPATAVSFLRGAETLGPYDSISSYNPPRRGGTNRDGDDTDTDDRPRSRQSMRSRSRSVTPRARAHSASRVSRVPSRSRSSSRSSSPEYKKYVEQSYTDATDEADHSPHGLEYKSMKAHRAALLAAQREREERAAEAQDARDEAQAAVMADQLRQALQLTETNSRLREAEDALRTLQAKLVAEKVRTGEHERRAAEIAAKREADRQELAVAVSILRRAKDDGRRSEAERRRLLRAFEETKGRLVKYHEEIRVRDARKVGHQEGRTEAFAEAGRWMGAAPPLPVAQYTTAPAPPAAPRRAVSQPNHFSLSPLGVQAQQLPNFGSAAQQFQQQVQAIPPQPHAPTQAQQAQPFQQPQASQPQAFPQPQPAPQHFQPPPTQPQAQVFQGETLGQYPQARAATPYIEQPQAQHPASMATQLLRSLGTAPTIPQGPLTNMTQAPPTNLPQAPPTQTYPPQQASYAPQRSTTPQVYPPSANVPGPTLPASVLPPVPVPMPLNPLRSMRSVGSVDGRNIPLPESRASQYSGMPRRHVAESFLDRVDASTNLPIVGSAPPRPRAPSHTSARPPPSHASVRPPPSHASVRPPTHRSQHSVVEVNKPLPDPTRHSRSVSQPADLGSAAVMGNRGPHKDSKYPSWDGPDPSFDNPEVMAMKAFQERAARVARSYRGGSDDLAAAAGVRLPPSESEYSAVPSRRAPSRLGDVMRDDLSRISEEPRTPARSVRHSAPTPARSPHPIPALGISIGGAAPELSDPGYHRPPTITVQPPSSTKTPHASGGPTRAPSPAPRVPSRAPSPVARSRAPSPAPRAPTRGPSPSPSRHSVQVRSAPVAPAPVYANSVGHAAGVPLPSSHGSAYTAVPQHPRPRTPGATYTTPGPYGDRLSGQTPRSTRSRRTVVETETDEDAPVPRSILKNRGQTPLIDPYSVPLPASTYAPSASTVGAARRVPLPPSAGTRYSYR